MQERTQTLLSAEGQTLTMSGARLVVLRGPDKGRAVEIDREEVLVGTAESADLRLTDPTVSRTHASLRITADGFVLSDLGSTNGTRVDGRRIGVGWINMGDRFKVGASELRLQPLGRRVQLPLSASDSFGPLIGRSTAARRLFALLGRVAAENATVLLTGETGTGKDLCAQAIHEASDRRDKPFVVVDCSAVVGALLESELFGHERGAFTDALKSRAGAFREADGGTLFLDEIGELPRDLQPKLLRALESKTVRPVGGDRVIPVDVRILAATHRDLRREVNRGTFREDLFFRLNVVAVRVPPLRERADDIALIAEHFWQQLGGAGALPDKLLHALLAHDWPGNVRELRNAVERALLDAADPSTSRPAPTHPSFRDAKAAATAAFERRFLADLMARCQGNVSQAARTAQMDRVYLSKLLRRHQLV